MAVIAPGDYGGNVDSNGNPTDGSGDNPLDLSWLLHPYGGHSTNRGPPVTPQPAPTPTPGTSINTTNPGWTTAPDGTLVPLPSPSPAMANTIRPIRPSRPITPTPTPTPTPTSAIGSPAPAIPPPRPSTVPSGVNPWDPQGVALAASRRMGNPWDPQGAGYAAAQRMGNPWDPQGAGYAAAQRLAAVPGPLAALQQSAPQSNVTSFMGGPPITVGTPFGHYEPTSGNARSATWMPPPPAPPSYDLGYGGTAPRGPGAAVSRRPARMTPVQPQSSQLFPHIGGLGGLTSFGDSPSPGGPAPLGPEALKHIRAGNAAVNNWWNGLWR